MRVIREWLFSILLIASVAGCDDRAADADDAAAADSDMDKDAAGADAKDAATPNDRGDASDARDASDGSTNPMDGGLDDAGDAGDAGDNNDAGDAATASGKASLIFPPGDALTFATTTTVRGRAEGDGITAVRVAGVVATSDDDFATWQASVPTPYGNTELSVEVEDATGTAEQGVLGTLTYTGPQWNYTRALALDAAGDFVWVLDSAYGAVYRVDLATGHRSLVSGLGAGSGAAWSFASGIEWDPLATRVLVLDSNLGQLTAVNPTTGARSIVMDAGDTVGAAPWGQPRAFRVDAAAKRGYAISANAVWVVNLDSASPDYETYSLLSMSTGVNATPNTNNPQLTDLVGIAVDAANGRVLVTDDSGSAERVIAVSTVDGARSVYSGELEGSVLVPSGSGAQPSLSTPSAIVVGNAQGSRAYVMDRNLDGIVQLDSTDMSNAEADRSMLSAGGSSPVGTGPSLNQCEDIGLDPSAELLVCGSQSELLQIDLSSGNRSHLNRAGNGAGALWTRIAGMAVNPVAGVVYVSDEQDIDVVELRTGDRTVWASAGVGSGVDLVGPAGLALDAGNDRLLVLDEGLPGVIAVDLVSGVRTLVSSTGAKTGPAKGSAPGVGPELTSNSLAPMLDAANGRLLLLDVDNKSVVAVNLTNGDRTVLSHDPTVGTGPSLAITDDGSAVLDFVAGRLFVTDNDGNAVTAVDLATGNRTVVSDDSNTGPALSYPAGIALDAAGGRVFVFDSNEPFRHHEISLSTGARIDRTPTAGPVVDGPQHAQYLSDSAIVIGADSQQGQVFAYDTLSYEVVLISR